MKCVYLDYNATTPLDPQVLEAIRDALKDAWGNPSSSHIAGTKAKSIIAEARKNVAHMIGCGDKDIVFTSGGTEANNMVLQTALKYFKETFHPKQSNTLEPRPHFITSNLEHDSIRLVLQHFEKEGLADVTYVAASKESGRVEVDDVLAEIRPTTCMITIMLANNETGIIQPIRDTFLAIRELKRKPQTDTARILLHTDAAQALGKIPVDVQDLGADYLTVVGHKFYGPRIGALYVRCLGEGTPLSPMFYGGGQERNYRPGTENTGMIAGLGKAAELIVEHLDTYSEKMREVRDYLEEQLQLKFGKDKVNINGKYDKNERLPNTCNVSILGLPESITGSDILSKTKCIQASVGAACHSDSIRVSSVLLASGVAETVARTAIRFSVGRDTSIQDIDRVTNALIQATQQLLNPT